MTDFGARGDDDADDTQAFLDGIAADRAACCWCRRAATSSASGWRSRRATSSCAARARARRTLFFPRSLQQPLRPGLVLQRRLHHRAAAATPGPVLATVTGNAARGATTLQVSATAGIKAGDWVRVVQTRRRPARCCRALYGGLHPGNVRQDGGREVFHHHSPGDRGRPPAASPSSARCRSRSTPAGRRRSARCSPPPARWASST